MSKKDSGQISIASAWLQSAVSVPGMIAAETTLNDVKHPGMEMHLVPQGLFCERMSKDGKQVLRAIIPNANLKVVLIAEPEEVEE